MTTLSEGRHAGEFVVSEANKTRSRATVTIVSGQTLKAGHVLGKVTASGKFAEYDPGNADGTETAVAVLFDAVDATGGDAEGVAIVRDAEVNSGELEWFDSASAAQKTTGEGELAAVGIIAR